VNASNALRVVFSLPASSMKVRAPYVLVNTSGLVSVPPGMSTLFSCST
jgi:hypothetical protein